MRLTTKDSIMGRKHDIKCGVSRVLLICEEDFERYLKETLPEWLKKERNKL